MQTLSDNALDFSKLQDIAGQLAYGVYTPLLFCFQSSGTRSRSEILSTLTNGLEKLCVTFPWLAGQVVRDSEANGGRPRIISLDATCSLIVNDYTNDSTVSSMETLSSARFPHSLLSGSQFCSLSGPPSTFIPSPDLRPVFFVQANFIQGGVLLSCAGEHSIMDGHGVGQVVRLLSKACRGETYTEEEIFQGNRARGDLVPLFDRSTFKPGSELGYLLQKAVVDVPAEEGKDTTAPASSRWAYFHFSADSLAKLKAEASVADDKLGKPNDAWISSNDAVSAFIWQCVSRVRCRRLQSTTASTFGRAVDVRPCLSISQSYLGNMSNHTYTSFPLSMVASSSLHTLASSLRAALNPKELELGVRSLATQLTIDRTSVRYGAGLDLSRDIFFSSWARLPCYSLDFNLGLGLPRSVRRPRFDAVEGLMYLLPMDGKGNIDAAICLSDVDLDELKSDKEWLKHTDWIG